MIDPKVFAELMNRGIITNVGLNPEDYADMNDLQRYGLATAIGADEEYTEIISSMSVIEQFLSAVAKGGKVDVPADLELTAPVIITKDVTINLNGKNIEAGLFTESNGEILEGETDSYVFWVKGGTLTIEGEGMVKAKDADYSMAVWANGGKVVINGGNYMNGGLGCDLMYASAGGNIEINDGVFFPSYGGDASHTAQPHNALNVKDKDYKSGASSIVVKGGRFLKFNPADNKSEGPNTSYVAEGFTAVADGEWYVVEEQRDIVVDEGAE